jgi:hypothetical protein
MRKSLLSKSLLSNSLLKSFLTAAAFATLFLLGAPADRAAAMMSATPAQLGLANSNDSLVEKAALVCGRLGCRRVWAGRRAWWGARRVAWWHRRGWWTRRVAWGPRRYWWARRAAWRSRPLFAYVGPSPALGWSSPAVSVACCGWGGSPGWGWSGWAGPSWSVGWGWGRPWGWGGW